MKGLPWRAAGEVAGEAAKASRSVRSCEDCLRAELKREFLLASVWALLGKNCMRYHGVEYKEGIIQESGIRSRISDDSTY